MAVYTNRSSAGGASIDGLTSVTNVLLYTASAAGSAVTATVENTNNTAADNDAIIEAKVGGTTSTGDPQYKWTIPGGTSWTALAANATSDNWQLFRAAVKRMEISSTGLTIGSDAADVGAAFGVRPTSGVVANCVAASADNTGYSEWRSTNTGSGLVAVLRATGNNVFGGGNLFGTSRNSKTELFSDGGGMLFGVFGAQSLVIGTNDTKRIEVTGAGNILLGATGMATTATDGHVRVTTCAGVPTGVPVGGEGSVQVDVTNHRWYFYSGGSWRNAGP
jgi:hypothetical protein